MNDGRSPDTRARVPRIGDLIDLEVALEADRGRPIEVLLARDVRIGREIEATALCDRSVVLAWLDRVRPTPESPGLAVEGLLGGLSILLVSAGLVSGSLGVAGWLWSGGRAPVNVVQLWPALIGVQLVLAIGWVAMRVASGRVSGAVRSGLSTWLPAALGALVSRFAKPGLRDAWQRFRALDRVYGGLRFWRTTALTQSFAVAFNVGALAALLFIPTIDDPAFGWRSRLMDAPEIHAATNLIAWPWAAFWPDAVPTRAEIEATEDSSLESLNAASSSGHAEVWAAWWPFLVASFLFYGLLPRLVLRILAGVRVRGLLAGVALDHADCARVRERLRRPDVDGRASEVEASDASAVASTPSLEPLELPAHVRALRWAGVPLDGDAISLGLGRAHGVVVDAVETVGGLDLSSDDAALATLRDAPAVLVVVEAWEAPSADYVDFLRKLRGTLGDRTPLLVLPCEIGVDGRSIPVEPRHLALWQRQLAGLADPWLRAEPYPAEQSP